MGKICVVAHNEKQRQKSIFEWGGDLLYGCHAMTDFLSPNGLFPIIFFLSKVHSFSHSYRVTQNGQFSLVIFSFTPILSVQNQYLFLLSALSKDEQDNHQNVGIIVEQYDKSNRFSNDKRLHYNGYSDEYLDRLEPNGNLPLDKHIDRYSGKNTFDSSHIV